MVLETQKGFHLTIPIFFDAAHQLSASKDLFTKKCAQLHGHTYHTLISIHAEKNEKHGMIIDFKAVKDAVNDRLDHKYLNDVFDKEYGNGVKEATAENIALLIRKTVTEVLTSEHVAFLRVRVELAEGYKGPGNTAYVVVD